MSSVDNGPLEAKQRVAVVGAGVAGLTAARELARAGVSVAVFDKGRGVAGRVSTRHAEALRSFDHGAQYFTVRDERFGEQAEAWVAAGVAAEWTGALATIACEGAGCQLAGPPGAKRRYVGVPGMNAIAQSLAAEVTAAGGEVTTGVRVTPLKQVNGMWSLTTDTGEPLGDFGRVLVTAPAPQASELLAASPALANAAKSVAMTGCWAAMVALPQKAVVHGDSAIDGAFVNGSSEPAPLSWIARDSSKPGRQGDEDRWVLHGSSEWTQSHLDFGVEEAAEELLAAFWRVTGSVEQQPAHLAAHLWRFAVPENALVNRALADAPLGLYAAGDWCGGPRVEGAWLSGVAAAELLVS